MGNTCVKLYMITVFYVYKKPIIIKEHRFKHKFQMCKEDGFTNLKIWLLMTTWFVYKIGFYKIRNYSCFWISVIMSWISFPIDILVELSTKYSTSQSSPHITFTSLPIEYASNFKVMACCLANCRREFVVLNLL